MSVSPDLALGPQHESAQTLALALESIELQAVVVLDPNGRIRQWSRGAETITGFAAADALERPLSTLHTTESRESGGPGRELAEAAERGRVESEGWRQRADGNRFWAKITTVALRDDANRLLGYSHVMRDLTGEHALVEDRQEDEQRLRAMVESVHDYAILLLDPTGRITSWNAGAERIKGWRTEEILGTHFSAFYPQEDLDWDKPGYELAIAATEGRFEDVGWRLRKDGTRFWANVVITALRTEKGRVWGYSKVTRDITDRKRAEEAQARTNDELGRRATALDAANRELSRSNAELQSLSYIASHDLGEPLRVIGGFLDLLERRAGDKLDESELELVRRAIAGAGRMRELLDALTQYGRVGAGELQADDVELDRVFADAEANLATAIDEAGAEIVVEPMPAVRGDGRLLRQAFQNLLANAIKFHGDGPPRVHVTARRDAEGWWISVSDSGIGIAPDRQGDIFQMFQRLHTRTEFAGTGIGLSVVKRIAELHGGDVRVTSVVGEGSTFAMRLPSAS